MKGTTQPYLRTDFIYAFYHIYHNYLHIIIIFIIRLKLIGRPKGSQSKTPSKARKIDQRIKFGNYHLDLVKHPENVFAMHQCLDCNNIFGYCTAYLSMPLDTWTHFVNALIPNVKLPIYDFVTIFRSSVPFLVT